MAGSCNKELATMGGYGSAEHVKKKIKPAKNKVLNTLWNMNFDMLGFILHAF